MTKKDYEAISTAFWLSKPSSRGESYRAWEMILDRIVEVLRADNKRFDEGRFRAACGQE